MHSNRNRAAHFFSAIAVATALHAAPGSCATSSDACPASAPQTQWMPDVATRRAALAARFEEFNRASRSPSNRASASQGWRSVAARPDTQEAR